VYRHLCVDDAPIKVCVSMSLSVLFNRPLATVVKPLAKRRGRPIQLVPTSRTRDDRVEVRRESELHAA